MKKWQVLSAALALLLVAGVALAEEPDFVKLENQMWTYARDKKWSELKAGLSTAYQSINEHGSIELKAALEALGEMNLSDFVLSDFKITRSGPVVVVSYYAQVAETIDGKRFQRDRAPRMSIWLQTDQGWVTIAHANFNALDK